MKKIVMIALLLISALASAQDLKGILRDLAGQEATKLTNNLIGQSVDKVMDGELVHANRELNRGVNRLDLTPGTAVCFLIGANESRYSDEFVIQALKPQVKFWGSGLKIGADLKRGDPIPTLKNGRPHVYVRITARSANGFNGLSANTQRVLSGVGVRLFTDRDFVEFGIQIVQIDSNGEELTDADSGVFNVVGADVGRQDADVYINRVGNYSDTRGNNLSGELRDASCRLTAAMTGSDPRNQGKQR